MSLDERVTFPRVALTGVAVSAVLVTVSVLVHYVAYRVQVASPGSGAIAPLRWLDVNREQNVPTAWSALLLLGSAATAAAVARRRPGPHARGWWLVAGVAAYLALDEAFALHERLGGLGTAIAGSALHFAWVVPAALMCAALTPVLVRGLARQPVLVRRRLAVAAVVYLTGALVLETVSGVVLRRYGGAELYVVVTAAEEFLEMVGASLLLATAVRTLVGRPVPRRPRVGQGSAGVARARTASIVSASSGVLSSR